MTTPNHRWGIRYSSDSTKNLAYIQTQYTNDNSFAKQGELFLNEALDELYYVDAGGVARKLGDRDSDTGSLRISDELLLAEEGSNVPSITGAAFTSPTVVPLTSPTINLSGSTGLDSFSLANGKEGQVVYFLIGTLGTGFYAQDIKIKITRANYTTVDGANISKATGLALWRPFYSQTGTANAPTVATAVFAGGAWNVSSGYITTGHDVVSGYVYDAAGTALSGVSISSSNGQTATTDSSGKYSFTGTAGSQKISASKTGYFSTFSVVEVAGGTNVGFYLQATAGIQSTINITGLTSGSVTATGTARSAHNAEIVLPQNSVVDSNGTPVDTAVLKFGNIVTSDTGATNVFPGYFLGDVSGTNTPIQSYGYINISVETSAGVALSLDPAIGATLRLPTDPDPVGINSIATWKLDETTGIWLQTGTATRVGSTSVFEVNVTSFSWYNLDVPLTETCTLNVTAWDTPSWLWDAANPSGTVAEGVEVDVNINSTFGNWSTPSIWQGRGVTDREGKVSLVVPPGFLDVVGFKGTGVYYNGFIYERKEVDGACVVNINIAKANPAPQAPPAVPVVDSFTIPAGLVLGAPSTLTWTTTDATSVRIEADIVNQTTEATTTIEVLASSTDVDGSLSYTPTIVDSTYTFRIIASNIAGTIATLTPTANNGQLPVQ
jgi:hypothetical protein